MDSKNVLAKQNSIFTLLGWWLDLWSQRLGFESQTCYTIW